jgi:ferrochelatase
MTGESQRIAVVLFNLGGPDSLDAVQPFLFNLFNDPAIIGAPGPVRWLLAKWISRRRGPVARENYGLLGGASPLLDNTMAQAKALEGVLGDLGEVRCFISMRYWRPFSAEVAREVKAFGPDKIVLLPLYPQFSTTTSGSSIADWMRSAAAAGLDAPTRTVCCYPDDKGFIADLAQATAEAWRKASAHGQPRILFSAHGLPERIVARGDPYQWQVEQTAAALAENVAGLIGEAPDWLVTYQSRVGRLKWIEPYTDAEIERAGREGRPLVVAPVAFVSEHSETLVELDIEYRELAGKSGVPAYERVDTVGTASNFIEGLAELVRGAAGSAERIATGGGGRRCPASWPGCPCGLESR